MLSTTFSLSQCTSSPSIPHHFDEPHAIAIAPFGPGAPAHLYGFVADPGHFAIRRLDLSSRKVVEPGLPVGRRLNSLIAHVGPSATADLLWGVDRDTGELVSVDPIAAQTPAVVSSPVFTDAGAASNVQMTDVKAKNGIAGTETWTATWRESMNRWQVVGASAGPQRNFAKTGDRYHTDLEEVYFTISQDGPAPPTEGDSFTFSTDDGVRTVAVTTSASGASLLAVNADVGLLASDTPPALTAFDLATGAAIQSWSLPAGAIPSRMELDSGGNAVYIADLGNPLVERLDVGDPSAANWTFETFPAPVPLRDVAVTGDGLRLFGMAADSDSVFGFVLPEVLPLDFTGRTPGFDPLDFPGGIRALSGAHLPEVMRGTGVPAFPVLVASHAGNIFVMDGATGCLDFANSGGVQLLSIVFHDSSEPSAPKFDGTKFFPTRCGGLAKSETWTMSYDALVGAFRVRGTLSGEQTGLMYPNALYTTDRGELTMEVDDDPTAPVDDGDTYLLSIGSGVAPIQVGSLPDKPVFFTIPSGTVPIEYALVPDVEGDAVSEIDLYHRSIVATYR